MTSHSIDALRPADGVELLLVEDEGILFDRVTQRVFHLSTVATMIWCHIQDHRRRESVTQAAARSMRSEPRLAGRFVREMTRRWRRFGLLRGGRIRQSIVRGVQPQKVRPSPICIRGLNVKPMRRQYRLLGTTFSLDFADATLEGVAHPVLAHLEVNKVGREPCRIHVVEHAGHISVLMDGNLLGSCAAVHSLAPLLQGILGSLALRRHHFLLALHAAGLVVSGGAFLLVGSSGRGKTSLAAALLAAGWDYLSDDTILLRPRTLHAVAVPYSLGIKAGACELLARHYPDLDRARLHLRQDGELLRYLSPPSKDFTKPWPVRWIVFPSRSTNATCAVRRLTQFEGLQRVMHHCCAIPHSLTTDDIRSLLRWSGNIHYFDMAVGDLDVAVARLQALSRPDVASSDAQRSALGHRIKRNSKFQMAQIDCSEGADYGKTT